MNTLFICYILCAFASTLWYLYLHKKTHIRLCYLYSDNLLNILCSCALSYLTIHYGFGSLLSAAVSVCVVVPMSIVLTLLRFYRIPFRKVRAKEGQLVSPADGNVIYIQRVEAGEVPLSVKHGVTATLSEFANTDLLKYPCTIIGINMTPFDVHRNCIPCDGRVVMNKHFNGDFLSLKNPEALRRNERNTILINTPNGQIGVVQTASRLVRRIVTWRGEGDDVKRGEWFGMIKFGSQVDLIIPASYKVDVMLKQQVYAKKTIIAEICNS